MTVGAPSVAITVTPDWAALLSRLQQAKGQPGAGLVLIDLDAMTLWVLGPLETLPRPRPAAPTLYAKGERP